jgi:membrane protein
LEKLFIILSDKYSWIKPLVFRLKLITLPGLDSVPAYEVWKFFMKEMQETSIIVNAKAIAFSYFLAIFPAMIFLFTLIPYIPIPHLAEDIIKFIFNTVPNDGVFNLIAPTINDITTKPRGGLLSFGILSALYFTSNGVMSMIQSFDASLGNKIKRKPFKNQLISLIITVELLMLFIVSIVVLVIGSKVLDNMLILTGLKYTLTGYMLHSVRYIVTVLFFFFSLAMIYYYGPTSKAIKFKFISTGATVATFLCIIIAVLFTKFVSNFNNYNTVYGSLGTIVFTMIWFYWNALALLIGFEINKSIYYTKSQRKQDASI